MATNQLMIKKSQEKWESRKSRDYARSFSSRMLYYYSSSIFCFCCLATSYQSSYLSTTEIYFQMMIVMYISLIISFLIKDAKQNAKWAAIKSSRLDLSKACPQSFWPTTQKLAWGVSFDSLDPQSLRTYPQNKWTLSCTMDVGKLQTHLPKSGKQSRHPPVILGEPILGWCPTVCGIVAFNLPFSCGFGVSWKSSLKDLDWAT